MNSSILKGKNYRSPPHNKSGIQDIMIYNFPEDVREKIAKILSLEEKPDFTVILRGNLEKGSKRIFNVKGTKYILFRWEDIEGRKVPRMIPYQEGGKKKFRGTSKRGSWDTPAGILLKNLRKTSGKL